MYRIVAGLCLLLPLFVSAQAPLYWSPAFEVAPSSFHNLRPRIALVQGTTPLVIWGSTIGGRKGWVTRWNGNGFDTPQRANPNGTINAYTVEGPSIAARGDSAYLVYATGGAARAMMRTSLDGGLSWAPPVWIDSLGADLPTFPNVSVGAGGNPIAIYMRQHSNYENPRYIVRTSTDAGQTWATEANASIAAPGGEVCDCCAGNVYETPGRIIALFRNNDNNLRDIWATWSTDGGQNFTQALDLDSTDWTLAACPSSGPEAYVDGDSIFTAFMSAGTGEQRIYLSAAHLDSLRLAYDRQLDPGVGQNTGQNYPALAGRGDTVGVVWAYSDASTSAIFMKYSFTGTAGLWSAPAFSVVSSIPGAHDYPDLAFENGAFHIVWANQSNSRVMYRRLSVDSFVVGLPAEMALPELEVSPNPVREAARIAWTLPELEKGSLRISDVTGRVVLEQRISGTGRLVWPGNAFPQGMYFVSLHSDTGLQKTLRIVVD